MKAIIILKKRKKERKEGVKSKHEKHSILKLGPRDKLTHSRDLTSLAYLKLFFSVAINKN
jgi:hypothetical protein